MAKRKLIKQANPPDTANLKKLAQAAQECQGCDLYKNATQAVFGEGPKHSEVMLVGEQPGDKEDLAGLPFVGPAGELLRHCLAAAGLDPDEVYMTNAVKHFKWKRSGKVRLHQKPTITQIRACRPWLEAEAKVLKPKVIVALGSTAATSVLGKTPRITSERGKPIQGLLMAEHVVISWHPSAILRSIDRADADKKREELIADLKVVADLLKKNK